MKASDGGDYTLLFSPAEIAGLKLRNRLVMAPTVVNLGNPDGTTSDRQIEYYWMRAEGGVGLIIVEATFVRADGRMFYANLGLDQDDQIPKFRRLTQAIKEGGAKAGIQLFHAGRRANPEVIGCQPFGPSAIPDPLRQVIPRELEEEEIAALAQAFVAAAGRAQEAGFDLICLHMAHGYLLHQFLTPLANQRQDQYGRDLQGRLRLPLAVLRGVRARLGPEMVISCRLSAEDGVEGGLRISDTCQIAKELKAAGAHLLDVSFGSPKSSPLSSPTPESPAGCFLPYAQRIREAAGLPVIGVGKIQDPDLAEEALASGQADLIALSRPLLADPDLPRKWREGRMAEVRRCTGDNKGCLGRIHQNLEVRCSVNPSLGRV
jgi:2,4-dienoyl-CoA reductase-like NADH-dependent reductase (Old Yellow Enzyme family)